MSTVATFILGCWRISGERTEAFIFKNHATLSFLSQEDKRAVWRGMQG